VHRASGEMGLGSGVGAGGLSTSYPGELLTPCSVVDKGPLRRWFAVLTLRSMTRDTATICWMHSGGRWVYLGYNAGPHTPGHILHTPEGDFVYSHDVLIGLQIAVYVPIRDQTWSHTRQ
jgi:hypothetical protein